MPMPNGQCCRSEAWYCCCQVTYHVITHMHVHAVPSAGFMRSGDDHIQAGDHGCPYMGPRRTARRLHHCGMPIYHALLIDWHSLNE
jgi:hypothetical protein